MTQINHDNYVSIYDGIEVIDALQIRIADIKKTLTIVSELDKWNYKGTYNSRRVSIGGGASWVRAQQFFKTLEFA